MDNLPSSLKELIQAISKMPGLGPRSGQRIALYLLRNSHQALHHLLQVLSRAHQCIQTCQQCGYLDETSPCFLCTSPKRESQSLCVVSDIADVWAMEKGGFYRGRYHILGGSLSALHGVGPEDIGMKRLLSRCQAKELKEVVLALNMSVEGQATLHYLCDSLRYHFPELKISTLAQGIPLGGELSYLDDGTLLSAFLGRHLWEN